MRGWTANILKEKKANGLIRGYNIKSPRQECREHKIGGKIVSEYLTGSDEKSKLQNILLLFCLENKYKLYSEYRFAEKRRFRFDWTILDLKAAFEYEGINAKKSGHTTTKGYTKDTDKYALAADAGFDVRRYTALNWERVTQDLYNLKSKIWQKRRKRPQ